jgi:hypothetical protein
LQIKEANVLLPVALGTYQELPSVQIGQPGAWQFTPFISATFYRIMQGSQERKSGDLEISPHHATPWVLRRQEGNMTRPGLCVSWEPASIVFLANGNASYRLAIGRGHAVSMLW